MTSIDGKIEPGVGVASQTLPVQLSIFELEYDELKGCHPATINVNVGQPFNLKIDFRTSKILCGHELHAFEFIRVLFEYPVGGPQIRAWIYQPYGYHWGVKNKKSTLEILASAKIDGVKPGADCRIHILNDYGSTSTSAHWLHAHP